jgi:hypothetical protein
MTPVMRARVVLGIAFVFGATAAASGAARAQCCPGYTAATACAGATLTKSRWCIQDSAPTGQAALPAAFCPYGDKVVTTLETLFNIKAGSTFEFELDTKTGGAHTGTACNSFGDGVAYDAFSGSAYGAKYFWGYLLAMHEAINDWTGMASGGWPTDWWADHQSAFPNLMDFHIMNTIGVADADPNLVTAAAAQKKRFYPGGDTADPKVVALDNVFALMPGGDGFAGFSRMFALQTGDGVKWDNLGVPNPDVKRSEYVVAYMSLAAGQSVLKTLQGPGANGGGGICNGTPDGTAGDAPYTCSGADVDAIATAHCAVAANGQKAADLTALRSGAYANVPSGSCGASCPAECACDGASHCVAPWLAPKPAGGGTGAAGASGIGADGGGVLGTTGVAGAGEPTGGTGAAGAGGMSGGTGAVGASGAAGEAGTTGGGTGTAGTPGSPTGGAGAAGQPGGGEVTGTTGCTCAVGAPKDHARDRMATSLPCALALSVLLARRTRARR